MNLIFEFSEKNIFRTFRKRNIELRTYERP